MIVLLLFSYFQQYVYYNINGKLDDSLHIFTAVEKILYENNSKDTLDEVWFNLFANAFKRNSRFERQILKKGKKSPFRSPDTDTGYIKIWFMRQDRNEIENYDDTKDVMRVALDHRLLPGDVTEFTIMYELKVPKIYSRLGHKGKHYEMSQWYPQISVYDSLGWHIDGYNIEGEFYNEFGDYDISINLPAGYIVLGTGNIRGDSIYSKFFDSFLEGKKSKMYGRYNVKFRAENVHDFVWVADTGFIVKKSKYDNTTIYTAILPGDEKSFEYIPIHAVRILDSYSKWIGSYPYKTLSIVDGYLRAGGGMEYPNLVIIRKMKMGIGSLERIFLEDIVCHEVGHQWFYGMLGSNEIDAAWLDEGFTTFLENRYMNTFFPNDSIKSYVSPFIRYIFSNFSITQGIRIAEYNIEQTYKREPLVGEKPFDMKNYSLITYGKGSQIVEYLRDILGEKRFDSLMHNYYDKWKFKHPYPKDFLRLVANYLPDSVMENYNKLVFSKDWIDFSIKKIKRMGESVIVDLNRRGNIRLPIPVKIKYNGGEKEKIVYDKATFKGIRDFTEVSVDPEDGIPELDEWNNYFPARWNIRFLLGMPDISAMNIFYIPYIFVSEGDPEYGIFSYGFQIKKHFYYLNFSYIPARDEPNFNFGLTEPLAENLSMNLYIDNSDEFVDKGIALQRKIGDGRLEVYGERYNFPEEFFGIGLSHKKKFHIGNNFLLLFTHITLGNTDQSLYARGDIQINSKIKIPFPIKMNLYFSKGFAELPGLRDIYLEGNGEHLFPFSFILSNTGGTSPLSKHISDGPGFSGYSGTGISVKERLIFDAATGFKFINMYARMGAIDTGSTSRKVYSEGGLLIDLKLVGLEFPIFVYHKKPALRWVVRLWHL